jgi:hypothetical protein
VAKKKKPAPAFQLGDYVKILHSPYTRARIIELRGPLGPGGVQIYRVRFGPKGDRSYTELRGDQLELLPPEEWPARKAKSPEQT